MQKKLGSQVNAINSYSQKSKCVARHRRLFLSYVAPPCAQKQVIPTKSNTPKTMRHVATHFRKKKIFHHFDRVDQSSLPTFVARLFFQFIFFFTNCNRYLVRVKWTLRMIMQKKLGSQVNAITSYRLEKVTNSKCVAWHFFLIFNLCSKLLSTATRWPKIINPD